LRFGDSSNYNIFSHAASLSLAAAPGASMRQRFDLNGFTIGEWLFAIVYLTVILTIGITFVWLLFYRP
jgi:hypothetical protein